MTVEFIIQSTLFRSVIFLFFGGDGGSGGGVCGGGGGGGMLVCVCAHVQVISICLSRPFVYIILIIVHCKSPL